MPAARFCPSAQLPALRSVIPPAASGRNQFRPGGSRAPIFCFSGQDGEPSVLPCLDALSLAFSHGLSSCCDRKPRTGRREDTSPGSLGESCQKGCERLPEHKKSAVLTSEVLPSPGTQLEAPLGSSMTDTPGITPARRRANEAHPSRSGFLPSGSGSLGPRAPAAVQPPPATAVPCQHFHLENKQLSKTSVKQERLHKSHSRPREGTRGRCWQCHAATEKSLGQEKNCARG